MNLIPQRYTEVPVVFFPYLSHLFESYVDIRPGSLCVELPLYVHHQLSRLRQEGKVCVNGKEIIPIFFGYSNDHNKALENELRGKDDFQTFIRAATESCIDGDCRLWIFGPKKRLARLAALLEQRSFPSIFFYEHDEEDYPAPYSLTFEKNKIPLLGTVPNPVCVN